jgi:hypothetical protein
MLVDPSPGTRSSERTPHERSYYSTPTNPVLPRSIVPGKLELSIPGGDNAQATVTYCEYSAALAVEAHL